MRSKHKKCSNNIPDVTYFYWGKIINTNNILQTIMLFINTKIRRGQEYCWILRGFTAVSVYRYEGPPLLTSATGRRVARAAFPLLTITITPFQITHGIKHWWECSAIYYMAWRCGCRCGMGEWGWLFLQRNWHRKCPPWLEVKFACRNSGLNCDVVWW